MVPYTVTPLETRGGAVALDVDGTSGCPIYVSDFEDNSEVAIRGDRKIDFDLLQQDLSKQNLPNRTKKPLDGKLPPRSPDTPPPNENDDKISSKKRRNLKKRIAKLSEKNRGDVQKKATASHLLTVENLREMEKQPLRIDVTALRDGDDRDDDENDPILERELEEIALNGRRSGLISGTPDKASYDVEHGKARGWRRASKKSSKKTYGDGNLASHLNDDEDKSWHVGTLTKDKDVEQSETSRKQMLFSIAKLVAVLLAVGLVSFGIARGRKPKPGQPLTAEQQAIHDVLTRVTGEKKLIKSGAPQHRAWKWLLYDDPVVGSIDREDHIVQRFSLASFYFATGGDASWEKNDWLDGPECGDDNQEAWFGINCNPDGDVRALVLDAWGLSGTIPPEVGHLYKLENLILKNNPKLTGWIPVSFSHLSKLRQLGLYNNNLSGVLPDIFEHTKSLKFINLESNDIYGSIPPEIAHLKSLETLVLNNNRFEGIVPFAQLASTGVKYLGLSHNRFAGRIERTIHEVETLEYLYLDNNQMRGPVPPHIGNLNHLKSIDLGNNAFTGALPMSIGNLERLEYFSLNNNQFNGNLPRRIGSLTNLQTLNTASNTFTGTVPDLSALSNLKSLQLYENDFTGTLPEFLQHLHSIETIFLSSNRFTGTIPEAISRMSRTLTSLYLSDNLLEGSIPTHLCEFIGLEALFLDTNRLGGSIPACFGDFADLQQLYLFKNKLTGTVPATLQNLKHLSGVGLESNQLVGEVPDEVCGVVHHQKIDMWADCAIGQDALECPCCNVCCPSENCI